MKKLLGKDILIKVLIALVVLLGAPYVFRYINLEPASPNDVGDLTKEPLGIKDLVRSVKRELEEADLERLENDEAPLFKLDRFELEINFVVNNRSKTGASIAPQFIVVDKETEVSTQRIQKIRIQMQAVGKRVGQGVASSETFTEDDTEVDVLTPPPRKPEE